MYLRKHTLLSQEQCSAASVVYLYIMQLKNTLPLFKWLYEFTFNQSLFHVLIYLICY